MTESASGSKDGDILSSIRHLVSTRPERPSAIGPESRLLLTPALRVANTPDQAPREEERRPARVLSLEERIAELEAAVSGEPADWEPDGSEEAWQETPDAVPHAFAPAPEAEGEMSGDDAAAADDPAEPAPDDAHDTEDSGVVRLHLASAAPAEEEAATAPATFRSTHRTADPVPGGQPDLRPAIREDGSFDEEALREIIAAVVREELQGQFGERITRGIRRMVRREIEKALTARELD